MRQMASFLPRCPVAQLACYLGNVAWHKPEAEPKAVTVLTETGIGVHAYFDVCTLTFNYNLLTHP